jgi:hypothetical protein
MSKKKKGKKTCLRNAAFIPLLPVPDKSEVRFLRFGVRQKEKQVEVGEEAAVGLSIGSQVQDSS